MVAALSANHLAALSVPRRCAVSMSPATTTRPATSRRQPAARAQAAGIEALDARRRRYGDFNADLRRLGPDGCSRILRAQLVPAGRDAIPAR